MNRFVSHAQARRSRHLWMATLETHLLRIAPRFAGKVDWDAATFHFNEGRNPAEAASLMLDSAIVREDAEIAAQIEADDAEAAYLDATADCAQGIHSWCDEVGALPADTKCAHCGETYGEVEEAAMERAADEGEYYDRFACWYGDDDSYDQRRDEKAERDADARQDR